MKKIKTAVVGVGHLGRNHARWYRNLDEAELVGVFDANTERAAVVAGEIGVPVLESLDRVAKAAEAVSIVVSTSAHYAVARELIAAGLHCLVEKPITATTSEAEELIRLAREKKTVLTVGHIERFNPAIQSLKNYDIKPRFIEAHRLAAFNPRGADVAVILDLMIHDIELCLHLIGSKVEHIDASAVSVISDTADIANARLTFACGAVANLTASRISLQAMRKLRIFQKKSYYSLDLARRSADIYQLAEGEQFGGDGMRIPLGQSGREISYTKANAAEEDQLAAELRAFLKAVRTGSEPEVSAERAAEALAIALEIERIGRENAG